MFLGLVVAHTNHEELRYQALLEIVNLSYHPRGTSPTLGSTPSVRQIPDQLVEVPFSVQPVLSEEGGTIADGTGSGGGTLHPVSRDEGLSSAVSNINVVFDPHVSTYVSTMEGPGDSAAMSPVGAVPDIYILLGMFLCSEFVAISINLVSRLLPGVQFMPFAVFQIHLSSFLLLYWYLLLGRPQRRRMWVYVRSLKLLWTYVVVLSVELVSISEETVTEDVDVYGESENMVDIPVGVFLMSWCLFLKIPQQIWMYARSWRISWMYRLMQTSIRCRLTLEMMPFLLNPSIIDRYGTGSCYAIARGRA